MEYMKNMKKNEVGDFVMDKGPFYHFEGPDAQGNDADRAAKTLSKQGYDAYDKRTRRHANQ